MPERGKDYVQRFIGRLKEIEKWAAYNKEMILGTTLVEMTSPSIEELIESAKPEEQTKMMDHIAKVVGSYFSDEDIKKHLAEITIVPIVGDVEAMVLQRPDGKLVLLVNSLNPLTPPIRKLSFLHEREHIKQVEMGEKEIGPYFSIPDPKEGSKKLYVWNSREVTAQKRALEQLEKAPEKIKYPILFHRLKWSVTPYAVEGANYFFRARRPRILKLSEESLGNRDVANMANFLINFFNDIKDFYNYHFGPLVHEKDDISREEHWEAYLDALRLLKHYAKYQKDLKRIEEVVKESVAKGDNIYERVAEEAKNFFKKVSDDGLPIIPLLSTTYHYAARGASSVSEKGETLDTNELYWHIVTKALEVLEEKYKKEPRKEGP